MTPWLILGLIVISVIAVRWEQRRNREKAAAAAAAAGPPQYHAGCAADAGLLPLHADDEARRWITEVWEWLVGPGAALVHVTVFGDLIVRDAEGRLLLVDTTHGQTEPLAAPGTEVDVTAHPAVQRCLRPVLAREVAALGVKLQPDFVLDWIDEPAVGGKETVDNLKVISLKPQQLVRATMHQALRQAAQDSQSSPGRPGR